MNVRTTLCFALLAAFLLSGRSYAQSCDAYFAFDGNLTDGGGSGYHGQMVGKEGAPAEPRFVEGRSGQALKLEGSAAMRAFADLNYDRCPRLTISAWVKIEPAPNQTILGTGGGHRLFASGANLNVRTAGQDLWARDAIHANGGWMFVAAVWDHGSGTHRLYWRGRHVEGSIGDSPRQPEPAIWLGADNDKLHYPAKDLVIDELRITGRALDAEQIMALQDAATGDSSGQYALAGAAGGECTSHDGCPGGTYCAMDGTCHPDSHRPMGAESGRTLQDLQAGMAERNADAVGTVDYDSPTDLLQGAASGDGRTLADFQEQSAEQNADRIGGIDAESPTDVLDDARAADAQRREEAPEEESPASAERWALALRFTTDVIAFSGVSGGSGDYTEQMIDMQPERRLPYWIETRENYDKPCTVYVHTGAVVIPQWTQPAPEVTEVDVCEEGLPRINPMTTLHREFFDPRAGEFGLVTGIQVCNNGINKRVKGIRARVRGYRLPDGVYSLDYTTRVFQERSNCVSWDEMAHCPANTYAIGLRLHFRDGDVVSPRDFLSGVELACASMQPMRRELPSGAWEPVPGGS